LQPANAFSDEANYLEAVHRLMLLLYVTGCMLVQHRPNVNDVTVNERYVTRLGDVAIFRFFDMAVIRHLGFVGRMDMSTWWFLSLCKIWLESVYELTLRG